MFFGLNTVSNDVYFTPPPSEDADAEEEKPIQIHRVHAMAGHATPTLLKCAKAYLESEPDAPAQVAWTSVAQLFEEPLAEVSTEGTQAGGAQGAVRRGRKGGGRGSLRRQAVAWGGRDATNCAVAVLRTACAYGVRLRRALPHFCAHFAVAAPTCAPCFCFCVLLSHFPPLCCSCWHVS